MVVLLPLALILPQLSAVATLTLLVSLTMNLFYILALRPRRTLLPNLFLGRLPVLNTFALLLVATRFLIGLRRRLPVLTIVTTAVIFRLLLSFRAAPPVCI